jgi:ankyrin repeat protein
LEFAMHTLLHLAAPRGDNSVIEFLVAHGIDLNAKNKRDATPLGATVARLRAVAVATGADPDAAVSPEKNSTVALLRKLGAN